MAGRYVGIVPTIALVVATALAGAHFLHREGTRTFQALRDGLFQGRLVPRQLGDAVVVLVGGVLLLTPGFLTDLVGLAMVLPWSRPWAGRMLQRLLPVRFEGFYALGNLRPPRAEEIRDVEARVRDADVGRDGP